MKRVLIIAYSAFVFILLMNVFYYISLYNKQISYIIELLDRQVQIIGSSVDATNNGFNSDLNQITFDEDLSKFFSNTDIQDQTKDKMKLFFSKYQDFVIEIKLFDLNKNEFTLKKDTESENGQWLQQPFLLHVQPKIYNTDTLIQENRKFDYYLPVIKNNSIIANIVVTVDYQRYFKEIFTVFNLKDYQWQWVISESGDIIYEPEKNVKSSSYSQLDKITGAIADGSVGHIIHSAEINGKKTELISSFYSTQLLQRNIGLVFSGPTDFFQKYIIRNSIFIVVGTLLLIQVIIYLFYKYFQSSKKEKESLEASEKMLMTLIEEMPVGVIIHNKNREIIKANKVAATEYSYLGESEMEGKIFPDYNLNEDSEYFSKNLGGAFNPDQFIILKKEIGEIVLYRNSIPVVFKGEEATMEILIDVTMLESARKQEAKANVAKSEFLARMSFEIRTPLNGIIGMTDVLNKFKLAPEISEIVGLLHRSTEVLLSIITDILDFSRIESGRMILDEIPFNLREEINYCIDLAKTYIDPGEINLNCFVEDTVPESIIGDPFRLRQVITNLLNHSISNTNRGEIQLKCFFKNSNNGIITLGFELLDTGVSFDKANLKKIFGEFVNIETKAGSTNDDSGFGTIISKQLVELMGGTLIAESPSGLSGNLGTKVVFTIMTYSNKRPKKEIARDSVTSFEQIKTMVITGSQNRDEEVLAALHKLGLDVSITTFQRSTVNQIKANINFPEDRYKFVVIFDDEEFDGFEAAKALSENKLVENFIFLMISKNDKKGNYLKCITLGIDHYLVKPFDISELVGIIQESFPLLENSASPVDIGKEKNEIQILVVEDNKMNQKVIGTMLKTLGYGYDLADDGISGYNCAKSKKYDLILMDLIMPEMDGFQAAQKIIDLYRNILIVAISADNMPETKRKAELSGIKDFISKPVRMEELKKLFAKHF
jgi:signal transduction histidine kinase/CheY-like chemotaxis protein